MNIIESLLRSMFRISYTSLQTGRNNICKETFLFISERKQDPNLLQKKIMYIALLAKSVIELHLLVKLSRMNRIKKVNLRAQNMAMNEANS